MYWGFTKNENLPTFVKITGLPADVADVRINPDTSISFVEILPLGKTQTRCIASDSIFIGTPQEAAPIFYNTPVAIAPIATIQKLYKAYQELMEIRGDTTRIELDPSPELITNTSLNILGRFT